MCNDNTSHCIIILTGTSQHSASSLEENEQAGYYPPEDDGGHAATTSFLSKSKEFCVYCANDLITSSRNEMSYCHYVCTIAVIMGYHHAIGYHDYEVSSCDSLGALVDSGTF